MTHPARLTPDEQAHLIHEVVRELLFSAPEGWRRLELSFRSTVGIDTAEFLAVTTGGSVKLSVPMEVLSRMDSLRGGMYEPGKGSWFTACLVLRPPGHYEIDYDYDGEPVFVPPLTADAFALDFEHYPRAAEHTPAWLREKLTEARGGEPS